MINNETIIEGAELGNDIEVGPFTYIGPKVKIGRGCEIQNNTTIPTGVIIEDNVFVGSNVCFSNVRKPKAGETPEALSACGKILVKNGVSIGSGATIVCNNDVLEIGENATIGAGAVVTKSVPPAVTVVGNPAGILVRDVVGTPFIISFENYYIKKRR